MPIPTPYAIGAEWQTNGSADFLHLKDKGGTIIGWIDEDGKLQGSLAQGGGGSGAGFGFELGAIVAGATGNTPAGGFTLDDGAGNTIAVSPSDFTITDSNNSSITDIVSGQADFVGPTGNDTHIDGSLIIQTAAAGPLITSDATVPSTTWDDGIGNTVIILANNGFISNNAAGDNVTLGGGVGSPNLNLSPAAGGGAGLDGVAGLSLATPGNAGFFIGPEAAPVVSTGQVSLGSTRQTTVGAAGAASPLPVTPTGYLIINVEGTNMVLPFYAAA